MHFVGKLAFYKVNDVRIYFYSETIAHVNSNNSFRRDTEQVKEMLIAMLFNIEEEKEVIFNETKAEAKNQAKRLIHNLTTLNAKNTQAVYLSIPQTLMNEYKNNSSSTKELISKLENHIDKEKEVAVRSLLQIAKNSMQFKSEINVYNALINNDFRLRVMAHSIHRVMMNAFYVFFPDFTDSFVFVDIQKTNGFVLVDYDTFQVALYYIIENASKYIKPHTELKVSFKIDKVLKKTTMTFDMISLRIKKEEMELIFKDGYSGEEVKKLNKNGDGIGLNRCKELLKHSNAKITILPAPHKHEEDFMGLCYQKNYFIIEMNSQ